MKVIMINEKSLEKIHEFLNLYGGLHEQPVQSTGKLHIEQDLPYYSKMMVLARRLQVPTSTQALTYDLTSLLILALELDYITSLFDKTYIPYRIVQELSINIRFNGQPRLIIDTLDSIMYEKEGTIYRATRNQRLIKEIIAFMLNLDSQLCKRPVGNITDFINKSVQVVCRHSKSKLHISFEAAQQALAIHYLNSMGVEPSRANDEAYLQYTDKKIEGEDSMRYYGEIGKTTEDSYVTIMMRPKTGVIQAETKYYQIRVGKVNDVKVYGLFEVDKLSKTVSVLPGPLTRNIVF